MDFDCVVRRYEKHYSRARALEAELCDRFNVDEPKHFYHVINNLLTPVSVYAELFSLGAAKNDKNLESCKSNLYLLVQYLRLLKKNHDFAKYEILEGEGFFKELGKRDAKEYVQGSYEKLGELDHTLIFMKS